MESGLRTATVVAETDVTCLSLTRRYDSDADALLLLVSYPPSESKFAEIIVRADCTFLLRVATPLLP